MTNPFWFFFLAPQNSYSSQYQKTLIIHPGTTQQSTHAESIHSQFYPLDIHFYLCATFHRPLGLNQINYLKQCHRNISVIFVSLCPIYIYIYVYLICYLGRNSNSLYHPVTLKGLLAMLGPWSKERICDMHPHIIYICKDGHDQVASHKPLSHISCKSSSLQYSLHC